MTKPWDARRLADDTRSARASFVIVGASRAATGVRRPLSGQRRNIGGEIPRLNARERHVRHLGVRIEKECCDCGSIKARSRRNAGKRWRLAGHLALVGGDDMA